jgi:GNAT superfamily N-acetyltransferase
VIRRVRADEAARLRELRLRALAADPDAFGSTYERDAARPGEFWTRMAERTFIYEDGGEWLGFIVARPDDDHPPDATINATWVAPEARGRGIATQLSTACVEWAREHGFPAITVAVVVGNEPARRAYAAVGFIPAFTTTWSERGRSLELLVLTQRL